MSNTYYLVYNTQGADLGVFEAENGHGAIGAMMADAGQKVWTANHCGVHQGGAAYDVLTWASEGDAQEDDGEKATSRAVLVAEEVVALKGSKADVLREIESRLGDEGTPNLAAALYAEGNHDTETWYVRTWDKALEAAIAYA